MAVQPNDTAGKRHGRASVFGVFLIFLGIVLTLQSFSVLPWELWWYLCAFWPVLIIAVGVAILMRSWNAWLVSGIVFLLMAGSLGMAMYQYHDATTGEFTQNFSAPVDGLVRVQSNIDFAAGELSIGALSSDADNLVELNSGSSSGGIRADLSRQGNIGTLNIARNSPSPGFWNNTPYVLNYNPAVSNSLFVRSAAASNTFDLTALKITDARFKLDATETIISLPAQPTGTVTITFDINLCDLTINIPAGTEVKIEAHTTAAELQINTVRLTQTGSVYKTAGYDAAGNRVEINLNCNLAEVTVN